MKEKSLLKKAKDKAQKIFNEYIRLRDCIETTGCPFGCICCTCNREINANKDLHAGHFIKDSKNGNATSFDEHNVNGQCSHCNLFLHGNDRLYSAFIIKKYGIDEFNRLNVSKAIAKKWTILELEEKCEEYKQKLKDLRQFGLPQATESHKHHRN